MPQSKSGLQISVPARGQALRGTVSSTPHPHPQELLTQPRSLEEADPPGVAPTPCRVWARHIQGKTDVFLPEEGGDTGQVETASTSNAQQRADVASQPRLGQTVRRPCPAGMRAAGL